MPEQMTLRHAAEMALEALEWNYGTDLENIENCTAWLDKMNATIPALRQALAQPEQEPFEYWNAVEGWVTVDKEEVFDGRAKQKMIRAAMKQTIEQYRDDPEVMFVAGWEAGFHSRTAGPKREWVGLTDDEKQFFKAMGFSGIDIVEAKLKEKNT